MWIPEYLTKNKTESSSDQTLYVDLPANEQISFLQIEISIQNAATAILLRTIMDAIDKIEIIADGVKTIYNLEPEIASYIQFVTQNGEYPNHSFNYTPSARSTLELIIPFGRYLYDPEYMLDTSLYDSVQLRIPYTLNATYDTLATFRHSIVMWRPLEKLSPVGFIRSRSIQKETSNTAIETIDHKLPMAYPWRYLGVRLYDSNVNLTTTTTNIKLNVDEGRLVPFDLRINELRDFDKVRYPRTGYYWIVAAIGNTDECRGHTDYPFPESIVNTGVAALMYKIYVARGEQVGLNLYLHDGSTADDAQAICLKVGGPNPHQCLTLFDGRAEPFPAASYSQAKIEYTLAAYEVVLDTFIQEIVLGKLS